MKLFEYAVIFHPNKDERKDGRIDEILIQPKSVLANDDKQAFMKAVREIPEDYSDKLDRIEVAVRPF